MTELTPSSRPAALTGLEHLQAIADGTFPQAPIARLLGFELVEVEHGRAVFAARPTEDVYNPIGSVHGGFAATLLDSAMGCSVQTTLPAGVGYSTLEISVNLVRGITTDTGRVVCEGKTIHVGRRTATAEGRLTAEATGKLLAHGTTTCLVTELSD
jgi:uncharacterized protein (TIGR00369 family)